MLRLAGRVGFELELVELEAGDVLERDGYRIAPVPVSHRGPALGYVLYEDERPGVFDPEAAVRLGLEPGPEFGRVQRGETVRGVSPDQVLGPPRPGRKLVLSGDTRPCEALRIAAHRADVLVHEATFAEEERERAADNGHSTARQAATIARDAEVEDAGPHPRLDAPPARAAARRGAAGVPGDGGARGTSTRSRSRSPSGASRRSMRWDERMAADRRPPRRATGSRRALAPTQLDTPRMRGEPLGPEHEAELADADTDPRVYRTLLAVDLPAAPAATCAPA